MFTSQLAPASPSTLNSVSSGKRLSRVTSHSSIHPSAHCSITSLSPPSWLNKATRSNPVTSSWSLSYSTGSGCPVPPYWITLLVFSHRSDESFSISFSSSSLWPLNLSFHSLPLPGTPSFLPRLLPASNSANATMWPCSIEMAGGNSSHWGFILASRKKRKWKTCSSFKEASWKLHLFSLARR